MKQNKETFCVLPFTMMSTTNSGDFRTCCEGLPLGLSAIDDSIEEVWNSDFYKKLRLDLINGVKHTNCSQCWRRESNGGYSTRQNENESIRRSDYKELINSVDLKTGELKIYPKLFEFKLGNLCNLKCIMCTQMESSQHETEIKHIKKNYSDKIPQLLEFIENNLNEGNEIYRLPQNQMDKAIDNLVNLAPYIQTIKLVGGEPLINPVTVKILEKLVDKGILDCHIEIITNLSSIDQKTLNLMSYFQNLVLMISYDSIDENVFHYIRYPANYKSFKHNLSYVLENFNFTIFLSLTINIFNILEIYSILKEFEKLTCNFSIGISCNVVIDPNYFSVSYLNMPAKEKARQQLNHALDFIRKAEIGDKNPRLYTEIEGILTLLETTPEDYEEVREETKRVLKLYNKVRNQKFQDIFEHLP
jgi:MoaA/NifB/PqqE/SkfB family radical SAM enzyme